LAHSGLSGTRKFCFQSFGFLRPIPNIDRLISSLIVVSTGVSAMRAVQSGGEKPNVRRKYLSPDEARRVIEASEESVGKVSATGCC
jgi:hypothetical protein